LLISPAPAIPRDTLARPADPAGGQHRYNPMESGICAICGQAVGAVLEECHLAAKHWLRYKSPLSFGVPLRRCDVVAVVISTRYEMP